MLSRTPSAVAYSDPVTSFSTPNESASWRAVSCVAASRCTEYGSLTLIRPTRFSRPTISSVMPDARWLPVESPVRF